MYKSIIEMSEKEARKFFLKNESYCNLKLPSYFNFESLLKRIFQDNNKKKTFRGYFKEKMEPKYIKDINYHIYINKRDQHSWRKITLINPIAYVGIVQEMCVKENWNLIIKRFETFQENPNITCCSIPVESQSDSSDKKEQIIDWWTNFEQMTIKEYMNYEYMISTDITNCYPSIYTHTISWALHDEEYSKQKALYNKKINLYGDILDKSIQQISYAQTNGIPQGSVLCDFIAEMVLGYGDYLLSKKLEENGILDYKVIRYRDDYRIFSNLKETADRIFKELTLILNHLNLQLNQSKTINTNDIVGNALKKDKTYGIMNPVNIEKNIQKEIYAIREVGCLYPNSGLLVKSLLSYYKTKILPLDEKPDYYDQLISIVVDIMKNSSRVYPEGISIISKLLIFTPKKERIQTIKKIHRKLDNENTTEYLDIWIQRLTITSDEKLDEKALLCNKVYEQNQIWDCSWSNYKIDESLVVSREKIAEINEVVSENEIDDFIEYIY